MRNSTIVIYLFGIILIGLSLSKWFYVSYDPSQALLGSAIGIIVLGFAYIHNWINMKDKKDRNFRKLYDSLVTELHSRGIVKLGMDVE